VLGAGDVYGYRMGGVWLSQPPLPRHQPDGIEDEAADNLAPSAGGAGIDEYGAVGVRPHVFLRPGADESQDRSEVENRQFDRWVGTTATWGFPRHFVFQR
jgi:hypothetical protein